MPQSVRNAPRLLMMAKLSAPSSESASILCPVSAKAAVPINSKNTNSVNRSPLRQNPAIAPRNTSISAWKSAPTLSKYRQENTSAAVPSSPDERRQRRAQRIGHERDAHRRFPPGAGATRRTSKRACRNVPPATPQRPAPRPAWSAVAMPSTSASIAGDDLGNRREQRRHQERDRHDQGKQHHAATRAWAAAFRGRACPGASAPARPSASRSAVTVAPTTMSVSASACPTGSTAGVP